MGIIDKTLIPLTDAVTCPLCGSAGVAQAAISYDSSPPHITQSCTCSKCGKHFVKHHSRGYEWYTRFGTVLHGYPTCCERSYTYQCTACGGLVDIVHPNPSSKIIAVTRSPRFECIGCGSSEEHKEVKPE